MQWRGSPALIYIKWQLSYPRRTIEFFYAILPKSRRATRTHCLNLVNSFFFFLFFSKKYIECSESSFFKFLLRGRTGFFFCRQLAKFRPKKKKRYCIMWLFLCVQQNLNHMGCSDAIHGWMMGRMDGWKNFTTSFNRCNFLIDVSKIFEDVPTFSLDLYQMFFEKKITLFSNYDLITYRCTNPGIDGLNQILISFRVLIPLIS